MACALISTYVIKLQSLSVNGNWPKQVRWGMSWRNTSQELLKLAVSRRGQKVASKTGKICLWLFGSESTSRRRKSWAQMHTHDVDKFDYDAHAMLVTIRICNKIIVWFHKGLILFSSHYFIPGSRDRFFYYCVVKLDLYFDRFIWHCDNGVVRRFVVTANHFWLDAVYGIIVFIVAFIFAYLFFD